MFPLLPKWTTSLLTLLVTEPVVFPHTEQSCDTSWVSYSLTQLEHCLPGNSIRPHRLRAQSHKTTAHFRCQWQVVGSQVTPTSAQFSYNSHVSPPPPPGPLICYSGSENSGKHFLTFTTLLKDVRKDTGEQSGEEMHRARSGRVPRAGASVRVALGCTPSGYMTVLSHLGAQRTP